MSTPLPQLVDSGFADALTYDAHRPSYPLHSVELMLDRLKVPNEARILEIGAGTGKLTEQLTARSSDHDICAVEPHYHMRQVLGQKALPRVRVLNGTAANIAVEDSWADAVVIAQVGLLRRGHV